MPTTLEQLQYGFDRDSRRTWRQRATTQGWDNTYAYDSLSQVIGDDRGYLNLAHNAIAGIPANGARLQYDETGNWHGYQTLENGTPALVQARTHDKGNRLMEVSNAAAMRTDRAGRMTEVPYARADGDWSSPASIVWDAWGRVTYVSVPDFSIHAYSSYDGLHRRTMHTNAAYQQVHSYYNDAWKPVEERMNSDTTASLSYLWGDRHRDDLVRRDRAVGGTTLNESRYVLMDYFSPAAITDENGDVTERYQYSAFGLRTILNSDFTVRSDSECGMEFSFQGQFEDVQTGWLDYGYRYYLPALGRWACKDPIGEKGGSNLYEMAQNAPLNQVDYLGLEPVDNGKFSGSGKNQQEPRGPASPTEMMIHKAGIEALNMSKTNKLPGKPLVEYCGRICCSKTKGLYRTGPIAGGQNWCYPLSTPPCNEGDLWVGYYHSHPTGESLSGEDVNFAAFGISVGATRDRPGDNPRTDGYNPKAPKSPYFSAQ